MKPSTSAVKRRANRTVAVFVSLVGMVAFTTVLLLLLAPPPLTSSMWQSLFAVDAPVSMDVVFKTDTPVADRRWTMIYVHHSKTAAGDAVTLAQPPGGWDDHFVIGNGDGAEDGEVQMTQRWNHQGPITARPPGAASMPADCISVCLVGDFSQTRPTDRQQRRLAQLVATLQSQLHIPADHVILYGTRDGPSGVGGAFPAAEFRGQILR